MMGKYRNFSVLRNNLRDAIRAEIATIDDFKEGAIMLSFVVKSDIANEFLDYPCGYKSEDNVDVDFVYSARPNSPKTRHNGFRGMTDGEVACRGYAALKIEGCCYAVRNGFGRRSCDMPDEAITWGRENDRGAVCFDINLENPGYFMDGNGDDHEHDPLILRIYIAVSGASGAEDERCAMAAAPVLEAWADGRPRLSRRTEEEFDLVLIGPSDWKEA